MTFSQTDRSSLLKQGIKKFNSGKYFEAHEAWEKLWLEANDDQRLLYQGLIHTAVGLYHLKKDNVRGGHSQLRKALSKMNPYEKSSCIIDLPGLISQIQMVLEHKTSTAPLIKFSNL